MDRRADGVELTSGVGLYRLDFVDRIQALTEAVNELEAESDQRTAVGPHSS